MCPECGRTEARCRCRGRAPGRASAREQAEAAEKSDGIVRVGRSTKGRKGKTVSTVTGLPVDADTLRSLAGDLKRKCGTGAPSRTA